MDAETQLLLRAHFSSCQLSLLARRDLFRCAARRPSRSRPPSRRRPAVPCRCAAVLSRSHRYHRPPVMLLAWSCPHLNPYLVSPTDSDGRPPLWNKVLLNFMTGAERMHAVDPRAGRPAGRVSFFF
ncbi:hypothetical protein BS78_02G184200 [Paspalum vaginatum]|nr:hypothetical protein BS78_02G184200 [Paspalum vaginatum]